MNETARSWILLVISAMLLARLCCCNLGVIGQALAAFCVKVTAMKQNQRMPWSKSYLEMKIYNNKAMLISCHHKFRPGNNVLHVFFPWGLKYGSSEDFHPSLWKAASTLLLPSIVLCYKGNPHMPLLQEVPGPLAMWIQANGNQLTPVESKSVHLVFIPCQIKERVKVCVSMIGPI